MIWALPLNRVSAGSLAVLAALAEVGVWIQLLARLAPLVEFFVG